MRFRPVVTMGTLLVLLGMAGSLITIVWQAGAIRATMEVNIRAEHDLREVQLQAIHGDLADVRSDVRDLRTIILNTRGPEKK